MTYIYIYAETTKLLAVLLHYKYTIKNNLKMCKFVWTKFEKKNYAKLEHKTKD